MALIKYCAHLLRLIKSCHDMRAQKANKKDAAEEIEEERAKVEARTPITQDVFKMWRAKKVIGAHTRGACSTVSKRWVATPEATHTTYIPAILKGLLHAPNLHLLKGGHDTVPQWQAYSSRS
eukprot:1157795-Pelagomonas_calceolata.AAC.7